MSKNVTRQCRGCDLNPGPTAPESSTLTTRLDVTELFTGSTDEDGSSWSSTRGTAASAWICSSQRIINVLLIYLYTDSARMATARSEDYWSRARVWVKYARQISALRFILPDFPRSPARACAPGRDVTAVVTSLHPGTNDVTAARRTVSRRVRFRREACGLRCRGLGSAASYPVYSY